MPRATTSAPAKQAIVLLDTHVAIWLAQTNPRLTPPLLAYIASAFNEGRLCLSAISAWETGLLVAQKRLDLSMPPLVWLHDFCSRFNISTLEITAEIAINSSFLPGKLHRDPADRMLVATARAHSAVIVTADANIIDYSGQGFVQVMPC